uniref:Uncharacterized protein n=1 Tax=Suricata suricatta TaxID=37032 RepID=A0A673V4U8_SURSU
MKLQNILKGNFHFIIFVSSPTPEVGHHFPYFNLIGGPMMCLSWWRSPDLEWKIIYVGSAESEEYDQVLDSVLVGPVPAGRHMFVFQVRVFLVNMYAKYVLNYITHHLHPFPFGLNHSASAALTFYLLLLCFRQPL